MTSDETFQRNLNYHNMMAEIVSRHTNKRSSYGPIKPSKCEWHWPGECEARSRDRIHKCLKVAGYHDHLCKCGKMHVAYDTIVTLGS